MHSQAEPGNENHLLTEAIMKRILSCLAIVMSTSLGSAQETLPAGAKLVPVEMDDEGLSIHAGLRAAARPKLICVAPSHPYPLGTVMSAPRRLAHGLA